MSDLLTLLNAVKSGKNRVIQGVYKQSFELDQIGLTLAVYGVKVRANMVIHKKDQKKQYHEDRARSLYLDLPIPEHQSKKDEKKEKTIPRGIWEIDI